MRLPLLVVDIKHACSCLLPAGRSRQSLQSLVAVSSMRLPPLLGPYLCWQRSAGGGDRHAGGSRLPEATSQWAALQGPVFLQLPRELLFNTAPAAGPELLSGHGG